MDFIKRLNWRAGGIVLCLYTINGVLIQRWSLEEFKMWLVFAIPLFVVALCFMKSKSKQHEHEKILKAP